MRESGRVDSGQYPEVGLAGRYGACPEGDNSGTVDEGRVGEVQLAQTEEDHVHKALGVQRGDPDAGEPAGGESQPVVPADDPEETGRTRRLRRREGNGRGRGGS